MFHGMTNTKPFEPSYIAMEEGSFSSIPILILEACLIILTSKATKAGIRGQG
uniref:Uncharacterized protein n=1 Tax=Lepeophtheirus salmonis TaxID=72036 RepID=A0A0K2T8Y4_LEPSM